MRRSKEHRHSMTSSAVASTFVGMVRPRAFALVRLMTRSNFVRCSIGRSAGFVRRKALRRIYCWRSASLGNSVRHIRGFTKRDLLRYHGMAVLLDQRGAGTPPKINPGYLHPTNTPVV